LAKPNYQFEKRQKDLKRKQKQEEKRERKLAAKRAKEGQPDTSGESSEPAADGPRDDTAPSDPQP
jgi:hypothetical protein